MKGSLMYNLSTVVSALVIFPVSIDSELIRTRYSLFRVLTLLVLLPLVVQGQISLSSVTSTSTQAIITYTSPVNQPCTLQVADLNRQISILSATGGPTVTVTTEAPHGLMLNAVVYIQNSVAAWN